MKVIVYHQPDGSIIEIANVEDRMLEGLRYGMSEAESADYKDTVRAMGADKVASFMRAMPQKSEAETLAAFAAAKHPGVAFVVVDEVDLPPRADRNKWSVVGGKVRAV